MTLVLANAAAQDHHADFKVTPSSPGHGRWTPPMITSYTTKRDLTARRRVAIRASPAAAGCSCRKHGSSLRNEPAAWRI
jgi:hypothetical protein